MIPLDDILLLIDRLLFGFDGLIGSRRYSRTQMVPEVRVAALLPAATTPPLQLFLSPPHLSITTLTKLILITPSRTGEQHQPLSPPHTIRRQSHVMILSPFTNPPYRMPTQTTPQPSTSPSSPPPHQPQPPPPASQSPKRKRSDSIDLPLSINTQLHPDLTDLSVSGSNSPRTKVAERLRGLELRSSGEPKVKRVRRDERTGWGVQFGGEVKVATPDRAGRVEDGEDVWEVEETPGVRSYEGDGNDLARGRDESEGKMEIAETPDPRSTAYVLIESAPSSNTNTSNHPTAPPEQTTTELNKDPDSQPSTAVPPPRITSPPPPRTSLSPLPSPRALSPTHRSLTWQDSEITGHLIDPTVEDDGEGINGIGFRPTPAMAYARQQKRKQQVSEWKAREAREARGRRIARRRGERGEDLTTGLGKGRGRIVRFEVGKGR